MVVVVFSGFVSVELIDLWSKNCTLALISFFEIMILNVVLMKYNYDFATWFIWHNQSII